jgi:hypothetical protein
MVIALLLFSSSHREIAAIKKRCKWNGEVNMVITPFTRTEMRVDAEKREASV